jgi:hypothetical protein
MRIIHDGTKKLKSLLPVASSDNPVSCCISRRLKFIEYTVWLVELRQHALQIIIDINNLEMIASK